MFEAYFDESGDPADPAIEAFTLSFLVASQKDWKRFETSWGRILRRYKISVMHMKDYEHRINEFAGWDIARKEAFAAELAGVLKNALIMGQCHSLSVKIWRSKIAPEMVTKFREKRGPYVFLLQSCLEDLVEFGDTLPSGVKIACIFDENKLVAGKKPECLGAAVNHYSDLKNARGWDRLAGITFENKREFVPLQAADMLAYEGYKDTVNVLHGTPRPRRKLLANLMQSKRIRLATVDLETFWNEVKGKREKSKS